MKQVWAAAPNGDCSSILFYKKRVRINERLSAHYAHISPHLSAIFVVDWDKFVACEMDFCFTSPHGKQLGEKKRILFYSPMRHPKKHCATEHYATGEYVTYHDFPTAGKDWPSNFADEFSVNLIPPYLRVRALSVPQSKKTLYISIVLTSGPQYPITTFCSWDTSKLRSY